ncbi:hypothetical protein RHS01_05430 [Rhizoctonia solani]|uniref:Uncharacterized protein n=1 Tax=Rhizoctonia solani TaxID=456999 RepID=A0A8H7M6R9_9AGAM|nr:hypothetical protein RHS01_05430 [Rhizoctonia solani]
MGQMQITQGGNLIQAQGYHKLQWDGCNASFVWLPLKPKSVVNPSKDGSKYLILAFILEAPVVIEDAYEYRVTWYEGKLGSGEVVDALTIQCAIGRIQDNKLYTCYALDEQSPGNPTLIHASDPVLKSEPSNKPDPDEECKSDPRPRIRPLRKCPTPNKPKNPTPSRNPTPREIPTPGDYRHPTLEKKSDPRGGSDLKSRTPAEITPRRRGPVFPSVRPPESNSPYLLGTRWAVC